MAPFTGLATAIRDAGHGVTIASNDEYESLVIGCGLEFRPLPGTHGMLDDPRWTQGSVLVVMVRWADKWLAGQAGPPVLYRHQACGQHQSRRAALLRMRAADERHRHRHAARPRAWWLELSLYGPAGAPACSSTVCSIAVTASAAGGSAQIPSRMCRAWSR